MNRRSKALKWIIGAGVSLLAFFFIGYVIYIFLSRSNQTAAIINAPISSVTKDDVIAAIVNQQGMTLAIVGIASGWLTLVMAVIALYQKHTNEQNKELYDHLYRETKMLQESLPNTLTIVAVMLFKDEFCFGARSLILDEGLKEDSNSLSGTYFNLMAISEEERKLLTPMNDDEIRLVYDRMYIAGERILKSPYSAPAIKYLAYMKMIYAKYRICRILEPYKDPMAGTALTEAKNLLLSVNRDFKNINDVYGHKNNLHGLILLWEGRMYHGNSKRILSLYTDAHKQFLNAINKMHGCGNDIKEDNYVRFLNHDAVALLNIAFHHQANKDIKNTVLYCVIAICILQEIIKKDGSYVKAYVNIANALATIIECRSGIENDELNGKTVPDGLRFVITYNQLDEINKVYSEGRKFISENMPNHFNTDEKFDIMEKISQSLEDLKGLIAQEEQFVDVYYRYTILRAYCFKFGLFKASKSSSNAKTKVTSPSEAETYSPEVLWKPLRTALKISNKNRGASDSNPDWGNATVGTIIAAKLLIDLDYTPNDHEMESVDFSQLLKNISEKAKPKYRANMFGRFRKLSSDA